jgi:hypothetical protein
MPAVLGGRPARSAGRSARRPLPAAQAGPRRRSPPGPPHLLLPAFPSHRAGRCRAAALPACMTCSPVPPGSLCQRAAGPWRPSRPADSTRARAGLDGAGGAERASWRTRGQTVPGTRTAPGRPLATPDGDSGTRGDPLLRIEEVTAELRVGVAGRVLPLAAAGSRPGDRAAARRRRAGPAQCADGVAAPPGRGQEHRRQEQMDSYDVRFWDIKKLGNGSGGRFRVRWAVNGREHCSRSRAARWPTGSSPASRTPSATGGPSTPAPACPTPTRPTVSR